MERVGPSRGADRHPGPGPSPDRSKAADPPPLPPRNNRGAASNPVHLKDQTYLNSKVLWQSQPFQPIIRCQILIHTMQTPALLLSLSVPLWENIQNKPTHGRVRTPPKYLVLNASLTMNARCNTMTRSTFRGCPWLLWSKRDPLTRTRSRPWPWPGFRRERAPTASCIWKLLGRRACRRPPPLHPHLWRPCRQLQPSTIVPQLRPLRRWNPRARRLRAAHAVPNEVAQTYYLEGARGLSTPRPMGWILTPLTHWTRSRFQPRH